MGSQGGNLTHAQSAVFVAAVTGRIPVAWCCSLGANSQAGAVGSGAEPCMPSRCESLTHRKSSRAMALLRAGPPLAHSCTAKCAMRQPRVPLSICTPPHHGLLDQRPARASPAAASPAPMNRILWSFRLGRPVALTADNRPARVTAAVPWMSWGGRESQVEVEGLGLGPKGWDQACRGVPLGLPNARCVITLSEGKVHCSYARMTHHLVYTHHRCSSSGCHGTSPRSGKHHGWQSPAGR